MTRAAELTSINCTSCGAGLSVLGGGRVNTHVCGYCGAVLDAQDNYKTLRSIGKRDHPRSPLVIGDTITAEGVDFTVIGTLGISEAWYGRSWYWVEHQLFSPTHGYAWASYEDGHLLFTRKMRRLPSPAWISTGRVEVAESPPIAVLNGERFRYYESGQSKIDVMEGEFNWLPQIDETTDYVTLMSDDALLTYSASGAEQEIERTVLIPPETLPDAVQARMTARPGQHPLMPYRPLAHEGFMRAVLGVTAAAALVAALMLASLGQTVFDQAGIAVRDLPVEYTFDVTSTAQLVEVALQTDIRNGYAVFETEVYGPDGAPLAAGWRASEMYTGVDEGTRWTEGNGRATFRFRPDMTGTHTITLAMDEVEHWPSGRGFASDVLAALTPAAWRDLPLSQLRLTVRERRGTALYMMIVAGALGLGAIALFGRRALHHRRRWSGTDWTDED